MDSPPQSPVKFNGDYQCKRQLLPESPENVYPEDPDAVKTTIRPRHSRRRRKWTKFEIIFAATAGVLALICVLLLIFLIFHYYPPSGYFATNLHKYRCNQIRDVCVTKQCVQAGARISSFINESSDPCVDPYEFSCGGWMKSHSIPEDDSEVGSYKELNKELVQILRELLNSTENPTGSTAVSKVQEFYQMCNNEKIMRKWQVFLKEILEDLGGWPVLNGTNLSRWTNSMAIEELYGLLVRDYGQTSLFKASVEPDDKASDEFVLIIDQPTVFMASKLYYVEESFRKSRENYRTLMVQAAKILGAKQSVADAHMTKVLFLETKIAEITTLEEDRANVSAIYNKMTVKELNERFKSNRPFDWIKFFGTVFPGNQVTESTELIVYCLDYLEKFVDILNSFSEENIIDYVIWRWFAGEPETNQKYDGMIRELPGPFFMVWSDYRLNATGIATFAWRPSKRCIEVANNLMPMATGLLYIRNNFDHSSKEEALKMIRNLQVAFKHMLREETWLTEETKLKAIEKVDFMNLKIGYPQFMEDEKKVDQLYQQHVVTPKDYFRTKFLFIKLQSHRMFNNIFKKVDSAEWFAGPATLNAFYQPTANEIIFPAGILQGMFYHKDNIKALNYGGIGVVIGHEITHGFDDRGRQYDKKGNSIEWFDGQSLEQFERKAQCIEDQYSTLTFWGKHINGRNTKTENIADNGGLKQAYRAYKAWVSEKGAEPTLPGITLTNDQLFFVSYAQIWCGKYNEKAAQRKLNSVHSPGPVRVKGPFMNSADYAAAFNCPLGTPMNPEPLQKCSLW